MKKTIVLIACIAAVAVCTIAAYNHAAGNDTDASSESTAQGGTVASVVNSKSGKVLVAYFSVPETDGVDASSGASRIVNNGKTMGSTHYVASVISEATGGALFEIKTPTPIQARIRP